MPPEWQPDHPPRRAPYGHLLLQDEESAGLWHPFDLPGLPPHLYQVPTDQVPRCRYFERYGQPPIHCWPDHHNRRAAPWRHRLAAHGLPHLRLRQNVHLLRLPLRERRHLEGSGRLEWIKKTNVPTAPRRPNQRRKPRTNERETNGPASRTFQKVRWVLRWLLPLPGVLHDSGPLPACLCYCRLHQKVHGCRNHLALRAWAADSVLLPAFPRFIHDNRMQIHRKLPRSCQVSKLPRVNAYWANTGQYCIVLNEKEWAKQPTIIVIRWKDIKDSRELKEDGYYQLQCDHEQHDGSENPRQMHIRLQLCIRK